MYCQNKRVSASRWGDAVVRKIWFVLSNLQGGILCSAESSGFTFGLEKSEDVAFSDWSLNVSYKGSCVVANEADLNLCNTSSGACRQKLLEIVGTYQFCQ